MPKDLFCHRDYQRINHKVCERKCNQVNECEDYANWDVQVFEDAQREVDREREELEVEVGVMKVGGR